VPVGRFILRGKETGFKTGGSGDSKYRPPRFPIRTRFRYRESGAKDWHQGSTIDISRSGVLFYAEQDLPIKTVLEMEVGFPSEMTGGAAAGLFGCGQIVRSRSAALPEARPVLAAFFYNYRFGQL
jgi:hypothetical protein